MSFLIFLGHMLAFFGLYYMGMSFLIFVWAICCLFFLSNCMDTDSGFFGLCFFICTRHLCLD